MRSDFAMLILSHGRAKRIDTIKALDSAGYTGKWYIVVDDEDEQVEDYKKRYGRDKVIIFNKQSVVNEVDRGDNFNNRKIVLYARNKSFEIAKDLGLKYFMELDDDYTQFSYRFDKDFNYCFRKVKNLDYIMERMIDFYKKSNSDIIAFSQGGDFIGGSKSDLAKEIRIKRKVMNALLCSVDRPVNFIGSINEDVNTYVRLQQLGRLMFTINTVSINQRATQGNEGGLTDIYLDKGTYIKSFYTVLYSPSCVFLILMGNKFRRIHHSVVWKNAVPKIISDKYKKK